ncbi:hypothetical protein C922_05312 [Plasmodium inui San Antonio 1]|uniref:Uncharacterized protein n=1 Tax=Plasmodium inui San Antonio 1 TaxID=1237626 RepID=W6ZTR0_9APIC|nr:hypothetical protein C922_05312 [Plasmodium inui San Antonio 1]EUD64297.1 hypothetical protein C922_05312 [Plasmodium inui San Antonio 1]
MEPNLNLIGELSDQIHSTAEKVLPDMEEHLQDYKQFMDQVMKNVRVPNGVTTLFVLLSIFVLVSLYNVSKIVGVLSTHPVAKSLLLYLGFYLVAYSGLINYEKNE